MPNLVLYPGKPQVGIIKIAESDTETNRVTAFTGASSNGSVVRRVLATLYSSDDSVVQMWYYNGTTEFILAECVVPGYSGMESAGAAITPYDFFAEGVLAGFVDSNGLMSLPVQSAHQIRFSMKSNFDTVGEYCNFHVFGHEL